MASSVEANTPESQHEGSFVVGSDLGPTSRARSAQAPTLHETGKNAGSNKWIWLCALAGIVVIAIVYYFAFSAAHAAQIRDVPLATKGGQP
jgi:hypothetical protein